MKKQKTSGGLGPFIMLWSTQAFSTLGSSMASFALIVRSYQQQGVRAFHSAAARVLLCAGCAFEHLCGRAERPLEQENHHAGLRHPGGGRNAGRVVPAAKRESANWTSVPHQRRQRADEFRAAARAGGGDQPHHPQGAVPPGRGGCGRSPIRW